MLIAVSGNVGSGKSTLAKYIAANYSFHYVPNKRLEFDFIEEFFHDIEGKFFPAQVSFLISKAIEIQNLQADHKNIVVDRSLLEDIQVFAKLWTDNKTIDKKIVQLYQHTADFITAAVPVPDVYVVCRCPAEVCADRIAKRPARKFEELYPPNHIKLLGEYYEKLEFEWGIPYVEIDTTYYDFRDPEVLKAVCNSIFKQLEGQEQYEQLSLYDAQTDTSQAEALNTRGMRFYNLENVDYFKSYKPPRKTMRYIYLAAPFTQLATQNSNAKFKSEAENHSLFDQDDLQYGELPNAYRNKLSKIASALEKQCRLPVLIPHRDINKWGKVTHPTQYITPKIIETVENAAALVAIPGNSLGVHLELGLAIAKEIPVIIFETGDFPSSFFLGGLKEIPGIKCLQATSMTQIPSLLEKEEILDFISGGK